MSADKGKIESGKKTGNSSGAAETAVSGSRTKAPARLSRPAMALASAVIIAAALNLAVGAGSLWYYFPVQDRYALKLYALATDPKSYDVIIVGSSLSDRGLIPLVMEEELEGALPDSRPISVFNASINGGLFPSYLEVMRGIVGKNQKPRLVLLVLAVRDFNAASRNLDRQVRSFTREWEDYASVMAYAPRWQTRKSAAWALLHGAESLLQAPLMGRSRRLIEAYQKRQGAAYHYPFTELANRRNDILLVPPGISIEQYRDKRVEKTREFLINDFQINPLIDRWMGLTIGQARQKGVALMVLLAPESRWFEKRVYSGEREQVSGYLSRVCGREGIIWVDLDDDRFRPPDHEFFDLCDHLGPQGAKRLSELVAREIIAPVLEKSRPPTPGGPEGLTPAKDGDHGI